MKKVKTGQKFSVKAEAWNSFIDAAEFIKRQQANMNSTAPRKDTKSGVVMLRNNTCAALEQFKLVSLGSLIITPTDNEQEFRNNPPVFEAELITDANKEKPFAVLQKPLAKSECGLAMLTGITPLKLNVVSQEHEFAELTGNGLASSDSGSVRILWKDEGTGDKWAVVLLGASTAGVIYDGFFAVSNASDEEAQKVKIAYGVAIINNTFFEVAESEMAISGKAYIYLKSMYSSGSITAPTIESASDFPQPVLGVFNGLIAIVEWDSDNSKIKKITQEHMGVMYGIIWGSC